MRLVTGWDCGDEGEAGEEVGLVGSEGVGLVRLGVVRKRNMRGVRMHEEVLSEVVLVRE